MERIDLLTGEVREVVYKSEYRVNAIEASPSKKYIAVATE